MKKVFPEGADVKSPRDFLPSFGGFCIFRLRRNSHAKMTLLSSSNGGEKNEKGI